jgi:hypothetical protein
MDETDTDGMARRKVGSEEHAVAEQRRAAVMIG